MTVTIDGTSGVTIPTGGLLTGVGSDSVTTFLVGNVTLNNTASWFNGPNTGSIGASGQKWLIIAHGQMLDSTNSASLGIRIYNGSTVLAESFTRNAIANGYVDVSCFVVVTLSAATTFTLQARDYSNNTGTLLSDNSDCTSITAVRLS